jgi:hypothetical protein
MRHENAKPSLGKTSVNFSGMPIGLATSSAAPLLDTLRTVQSIALPELNRSGLEYPVPISGPFFDHDLPLRSLKRGCVHFQLGRPAKQRSPLDDFPSSGL